jgi:class 3 adenylate cyclase/pimeloyl-ACP methyl ester carboxylesterase
MEPRVQYATTSDGVSIAYWSIGSGLPLVCPPPAMPWSHIELEWQIPEWRHWYEHLTENLRVVRYDNRGSGLSDRDAVIDGSLDAAVRDLEAVVDRLELERFALYGCYGSGRAAIAYAARHPRRVSHLVLWCAFASQINTPQSGPVADALRPLLSVNYELFSETLAHTIFGWDEGPSAHRFAQYMQQAMDADAAARCMDLQAETNVEDLLPQITVPTLVLHRRDFAALDMNVARRLAAGIPNARLKIVEGKSLSPYVGEMRPTLDAINEFLGVDPARSSAQRHLHQPAPAGGSTAVPVGGFRTIMFTDIEGSTALTQRLGDSGAQELVRLHNAIVNDALASNQGTLVKHTGDGMMASFLTASAGVECAVAIQRAFEEHNRANPGEQVHVRIGLNAGEPVFEGEDLFGTAVQLARRVCDFGEPGQILIPEGVRHLVAGKGFLFADRGIADLKGFEDPVRVFEVRWREDA